MWLFRSSKDVATIVPDHNASDDAEDLFRLHGLLYNYVCRENDLLNHRTTWFLAIQSAAVFGIAFVLRLAFDKLYDPIISGRAPLTPEAWEDLIEVAALSVPCWVLGWLCAYAADKSIRAAILAQETLADFWAKHYPNATYEFGLPRLMGGFSAQADRKGAFFADALVKTMLIYFWPLVFIGVACLLGRAFWLG